VFISQDGFWDFKTDGHTAAQRGQHAKKALEEFLEAAWGT
jgi:hypothetical protein